MKFNDRLDGIFGPIKLDYHRYNFFFIEVHVASQNNVSGVYRFRLCFFDFFYQILEIFRKCNIVVFHFIYL